MRKKYNYQQRIVSLEVLVVNHHLFSIRPGCQRTLNQYITQTFPRNNRRDKGKIKVIIMKYQTRHQFTHLMTCYSRVKPIDIYMQIVLWSTFPVEFTSLF